MFGSYQSMEELMQNLMDIGCSEKQIQHLQQCDKQAALSHLEELRTALLEKIHQEQSSIESLNAMLQGLRSR